jgi:hypothetical protein
VLMAQIHEAMGDPSQAVRFLTEALHLQQKHGPGATPLTKMNPGMLS